MMLLSRIFLIEFGVCVAGMTLLLAWQVARVWWARRRRLSLESVVLLAGAVATSGAYGVELLRAERAVMPGISWVWVMTFGASCAMHVGLKAMRVLKKR